MGGRGSAEGRPEASLSGVPVWGKHCQAGGACGWSYFVVSALGLSFKAVPRGVVRVSVWLPRCCVGWFAVRWVLVDGVCPSCGAPLVGRHRRVCLSSRNYATSVEKSDEGLALLGRPRAFYTIRLLLLTRLFCTHWGRVRCRARARWEKRVLGQKSLGEGSIDKTQLAQNVAHNTHAAQRSKTSPTRPPDFLHGAMLSSHACTAAMGAGSAKQFSRTGRTAAGEGGGGRFV